MRFTRIQAISLVALLQLVIPIALIVWHVKVPHRNIIGWASGTLLLLSYVLFIYLAGTWAFGSYYIRYALVIASLATVVRSLFNLAGLPLLPNVIPPFWIQSGMLIAVAIVLAVLSANAIRARYFEQETISLSFPFRGGVHSVFEGGNGQISSLMNYHFGSAVHGKSGVNNSMKYAVDITRLSAWGNDANGIFPRKRERYPVFNEIVLSPCDSVVAGVLDGQPNEDPWSGKGPYNLGNYVLLQKDDYYVLLGHLQKGSIRVVVGSVVKIGEPVALVGNSGWTSQPHLHIQAMNIAPDSFWKGEGVPIVFDGRNPFKNQLFFR
jgi:hypothetical protein